VLAANLHEQARHCFKVTAASGNFSGSKFGGESCSVNCPGIPTRHSAFEGRETHRGIFNERGEQWRKHLLHTSFAQLRAEALDIHAR